jgi:glycosyltransferase involved in cell wall biosynthesis
MRLLFFGTYDARRHPRVEVLIEGFRANGDEVVECNVPLGLDTSDKVRMLKKPWLLGLLALRLARAWTLLAWRARRVGPVDAVVVGYLGHLDVLLARRLFRRKRIALDYLVSLSDTGKDRGGGRIVRALASVDRRAARASDLVVLDTPEQSVTVLAAPREGTVVVPVGAPEWWFSAPRALDPAPLKVVFFGLYTPLQGCPAIGRAIAALADEPGVAFTMIGTGQDRAETEALARGGNVTWLDWVDPAALPEVVASHHVCLGVFGTGKGERVVPNKVYQGAAAGCVVVTSDTPPQRSMMRDAAVYVPTLDGRALAAVLRSLAHDPDRVAKLREAAYALAQERFHPETVVAPLRSLLAGGTP